MLGGDSDFPIPLNGASTMDSEGVGGLLLPRFILPHLAMCLKNRSCSADPLAMRVDRGVERVD